MGKAMEKFKTGFQWIRAGLLLGLTVGVIYYVGSCVKKGGEEAVEWNEARSKSSEVIELAETGYIDSALTLLKSYSSEIPEEKKADVVREIVRLEQTQDLDELIADYDYEEAKRHLASMSAPFFSKKELDKLGERVEEISPEAVFGGLLKEKKEERKIAGLDALMTMYSSDAELVCEIEKELIKTYSNMIVEKLDDDEKFTPQELLSLFGNVNTYLDSVREQDPGFVPEDVSFLDKAFEYLYLKRVPSVLEEEVEVVTHVALGYLNGKTGDDYFFGITVDELPIGTKGEITNKDGPGMPNTAGNIEVKFDNRSKYQWMKVSELKRVDKSYETLGDLAYNVVKELKLIQADTLTNEEFIADCWKKASALDKNSLDYLDYLLRAVPEEERTEEFTQKLITASRSLAHDFYAKKQDYETAFYLLLKAEELENQNIMIAEKGDDIIK